MQLAAADAVEIVELLERAGMAVWLDGGWGVDALLGRQTREHDDLDLLVELAEVPRLVALLADLGYELLGGAPPASFELIDAGGRQIDVHPVRFDEAGNGVYRMRDGTDWIYPSAGFGGTGSIRGRPVRCLTPAVQALCHAGYELDGKDHHDLQALHERFGVDLPDEPPASR